MTKALAGLIIVVAVVWVIAWAVRLYATARVKAAKWDRLEAERRAMTVIQDKKSGGL